MGDGTEDVSDFMTVHKEDVGRKRFQICWSCTEGYRQERPVRVGWRLADGNRHLTVTLNDVVYFSDMLPAEAASGEEAVEYKIKHHKKFEQVYILIQKREQGLWIS